MPPCYQGFASTEHVVGLILVLSQLWSNKAIISSLWITATPPFKSLMSVCVLGVVVTKLFDG